MAGFSTDDRIPGRRSGFGGRRAAVIKSALPVTRKAGDRALILLNGSAGIGAVGGMVYALKGAPDVPVKWLAGSPFSNYKIPGLFLGCVYAPASLGAAWLVWRNHSRATDVAFATASLQISWIAAQVGIIGYRSPFSPRFSRSDWPISGSPGAAGANGDKNATLPPGRRPGARASSRYPRARARK